MKETILEKKLTGNEDGWLGQITTEEALSKNLIPHSEPVIIDIVLGGPINRKLDYSISGTIDLLELKEGNEIPEGAVAYVCGGYEKNVGKEFAFTKSKHDFIAVQFYRSPQD